MSGECLVSVWWVSGECLVSVWWVSGGCMPSGQCRMSMRLFIIIVFH